MINKKLILKLLGSLLWLEAILFAVCLALGVYYHESVLRSFGIPILVAFLLGTIFIFAGRGAENRMGRRDGFLSVSLSWTTFCLVGCLPFILSGTETRFAAAFFEAMSGFSTTGSTILNNIDDLPRSILFWRSLTHWFGGMGIVFFTIAILPIMGTGDIKLFSAETSGLKLDKLHPRLSTTARWLIGFYLILTAACTAAYCAGGMSPFDAVNHAFSTIATGGFSTHQSSFAFFNSPTLEGIAVVFMLLSGLNFSLLYLLIIRRRVRRVLSDGEVRCYLLLFLVAVATVAGFLIFSDGEEPLAALRQSVFNVASFQTTTGFTVSDPSPWPPVAVAVLVLVGLVGACAGSTSGGVKCVRLGVAVKVFTNEFRRMLHPNAVLPLRLGRTNLTAAVATTVFAFLMAYALLLLIGSFVLICLGIPAPDAIDLSISSLSNVGPAFGSFIGPLDSWSEMPDLGLWVSSFLMLAGRLEIFSLILPFTPGFWRDN